MAKKKDKVKVEGGRMAGILPCSCESAYQDKAYGRGKRVHNNTKSVKSIGGMGWRCTVCGTSK